MGKGDEDGVKLSDPVMEPVQAEDGYHSARSEACSESFQKDKSVIVVHNGKEFGSQKYSDIMNRSCYVSGTTNVTLINALGGMQRPIEFSEQTLPLSALSKSDTLVISEASHLTNRGLIDSSNKPLLLSLEEDLPNEMARTAKWWKKKGRFITLLSPMHGYPHYYLPNSQKVQGKQCPNGGGSSKGSQSESGGGGQASCVTGHSPLNFQPSLVTGLGGGIGGGGGDDDPWYNRPIDLPRSHYDDFVLWDDEMETEHRDIINALAVTPDEFLMGSDPFTFISQRDDIPDMGPPLPLQSPMCDPLVEMVAQAPTQSTEESTSEIENSFDIIHLMSGKQPPVLGLVSPANPVLPCQMMPLPSPSPSTPSIPPTPMQPPTPSLPPTPMQPLTPIQPATPMQPPTPLQPPTPSSIPASPVTPTPANLLQPKTYIEGDLRYCELSVPEGIPQAARNLPLRALFFTTDLCYKYKHCMTEPCDLKVSNDVRAKLCECNFDLEQTKLVFTLPKECKPLDQWLTENEDRADVRDRQLILQQVINTLAAIHTVGNEDLLSLWGAFMVWIAPDLRVYLLVDFPVLLQKQKQAAFLNQDRNLDPRLEDIKAIQKVYEQLLKPYLTRNTSWVSPSVQSLLALFESLLVDPSSGSRMAEIARTLGEKRMCKLEIELLTLPVTIYSIEHEALHEALHHLQSMVPYSIARVWKVIWSATEVMVGRGDVTTADGVMRLGLVPATCATDEGLFIASDFPSPV